jgi:glycerate kinase
MKILIAPDSFKGSLRAKKVAEAISKGILKRNPEIDIEKIPLADGGEGTLEAILCADPLHYHVIVENYSEPLSNKVNAFFLYNSLEKTAWIEMAQTAGLELLKPELRNPMIASTKGVGQQIKHAIEIGVKKIILFVGGSATNDAGIGMASELGWVFKDALGEVLEPVANNIEKIKSILPPNNNLIDGVEVQIATDVTNPFFGINGASKVFGKQKGASINDIELLDQGLKNFATIFEADFGIDLQNIPGSGAAGGLAGGGIVFLSGKIVSGTDQIFKMCSFEEKIKISDLVITGEGKIDHQTFEGKLVSAVLNLCDKYNKKVILVAGKIDLDFSKFNKPDIIQIYELIKGHTLEFAIENAENLLEKIDFRLNHGKENMKI